MCVRLLISWFAENVIAMLTCSMTHEMQLTVKNDGSLLTSRIRARNLIIQLVVLKM